MSFSLFRKGFTQRQQVGTAAGDTTTTTRNVIALNKDYLTSEYKVMVVATQAYSVIPTGASLLDAIASATLEFSGSKRGGNGVRYQMSGRQLVELARLFEPNGATSFSAAGGTATAKYLFDLYLMFPQAYNDLQAAVYSNEFSSITLTINWATYAAAAVFSGGTMTGTTVNYAVTVTAETTPVPYRGKDSMSEYIATLQQTNQSIPKSPTGAGAADDVLLQTGNKVRLIHILCYDGGGALSDSIVQDVSFSFAGYNYKQTFADLKQDNLRDRGYSQTGSAFIDFGDDPNAWCDLTALNEARLKWNSLAAGTVYFNQINARELNH